MSKIAFVGLGIMGAPMAGHLLAGGHDVYLYDIRQIPAELLQKGGIEASSAQEAARNANIVIIMVPDTPHVAAALFDAGGVEQRCSNMRRVGDHDDDDVGVACRFLRRRSLDSSLLQKLRRNLPDVVEVDVVTTGQQVAGHRSPHDSQPNECDLAHLPVFKWLSRLGCSARFESRRRLMKCLHPAETCLLYT